MILFVDQSGQMGGAELCLADLASHFSPNARVLLFSDGPFVPYLEERGVPVSLVPLPAAVARTTKNTSPLSLLTRIPALVRHSWKLRSMFQTADVLYLNTAKALLLGAFANAFARRPCIFHLHDLWTESHFSRRNIRLLVAAANRVDAVIANSEASAEAFREAGGRTPLEVIPNGFPVLQESTGVDLRKIENPGGGPVAAVFGRLARWKGQHLLLEAALEIPGLTVWIVGEALFTADDEAYAAELRAIAAGMGERVRFLGFRSDVPDLMRAADFIVHCSTSPEPFGRVVVEGMLAGRPVIAADAGGPREIVRGGVTGILVPPGDRHALASALRRLIASPEDAKKMGAAGREVAVNLYSLERVFSETARVIQSVRRP
ncbi:MAG: glycosyltransferase family 4 protein [Terrimicrobiaceae bacterium]|jgi:glycosyltransferase involved in cell wall biosynthesis